MSDSLWLMVNAALVVVLWGAAWVAIVFGGRAEAEAEEEGDDDE